MDAPPVSSIRSACTVVLLRDAGPGLEVLLLRRDPDAKFMPGFYVFAGGAVVPEDRDERATSRVTGVDDGEASQRLGIESDGLTYLLAGVRETFEECGILLAVDEASGELDAAQWAEAIADRAALNAGTLRFAEFLEKHRLVVPGNTLVYFDHWLTPAGRPRRFDTRFFLARGPEGQSASHDQAEMVDVIWLRPQDALAMAKRKEIDLANATTTTLAMLAERATVEEALERARSLLEIEPNRPCTAQGRAGPQLFHRKDAAYHEVHWCDPLESMQTTYDLLPGHPKQLDRWVARIIAPNRGPMTGPGTNTYFVGDDELAVIDPGPLDDGHLAALVEHGAGRIRWILCTHTHRDHSPGAARLAAATGAEVIGIPPPADPRHDLSFAPNRIVRDGELIELGTFTLMAIHTPGHASNHLCFRLVQNGMLFTGDHVMQGSTVVIGPPDGDMQEYLNSLRRLLTLDIAIMAPGHGYLIGRPHREVHRLIEHRLWREARIMQAVESRGATTVEEILDHVYPDVLPVLRGPAAQSLTAHLRKLIADGAVTAEGGRYRRAVQ